MKRESGAWLPGVLLIVGILFLILSGSGLLTPLENVLSFATTPIERLLASFFDTLGTLTQTSRDVRELQAKVDELQQANDLLVQENIRLREFAAETEQLRTQLTFAEQNPTYHLVGADVVERGCETYPCGDIVGQDTNPYLRYIIINAGSRHGVAVGMPVVTGGAVMVGRIARVSPNLAYVQLINDPQSEIAAMLQQSRISGMVVGSAEGAIVLTEILPDEAVTQGETIISSAVGGLLPRGLILGQVEEVQYQESQLFQEASIRPAIDFRRLETVLVITNFLQPDLEELEEAP
ncbi:MAG: rod shape-determining protein MreC [Anaerolineae bacterium]|nr:rod shape-determining protein MreC [Anaerolineae bacterium]